MTAWNVAVLVFREGLESILVLAAITASLTGQTHRYRWPILAGASVALAATLASWRVAIRVIADLTESMPALDIQAATGLLALCVLLVVMNWFFHKVYWTGWITRHTEKKRALLRHASAGTAGARRILIGFALLGFTSVYREGVETVLFLQSYRLKLGQAAINPGIGVGLLLTLVVAVVTFVAERRLPYRKMLVTTGVLLGLVLLVMVGEQAQEMQAARWLPTTPVAALTGRVPDWMSLWFSVFPTVETLAAQAMAAVLVLGSYVVARRVALRPRDVPQPAH